MCSPVSSEGAAPPIIDLSGERAEVARQVRAACSSWGAFVATGHGVPLQLLDQVLAAGHSFFDLPLEVKQRLCLTQQGTSWRGYMALGGESSEQGARVDHKEGLYLGAEHADTDPRVLAGLPTFGRNVLPDAELPGMRGLVASWVGEMRGLGDRVMQLLSLGLGLEPAYIGDHVTRGEPVLLPRMFR